MPEQRAAILIVDDEAKLRLFLRREFERKGHAVFEADSRDGALAQLAESPIDVVLLDIIIPGADGIELLREIRVLHPAIPVVMLTGNASVETAIRALKLGARDYLSKPYDMRELELLIERTHEESCLREENAALRIEHSALTDGPHLIGTSAELAAVKDALGRLAQFATPVLISGERGSGKEVAARVLHQMGPKRRGPFLTLDSAVHEEPVLEAKLFGHASQKGILELCGRGTVLLDDIGRLPLGLQEALKRLFETGEARRSDGNSVYRPRCRVVAVTAEDLEEAVRKRRFLRDLFSRLSTAHVVMPALRDRPEDIAPLAESHLARRHTVNGKGPRQLEPEAVALLKRFPWPGNVRQLEGVLDRSLLRTSAPSLAASDIYLPSAGGGPTEAPESLAAVERSHILKVLAQCEGNRSRAASVLGIDPKTLYNKLKEFRSDMQ